MAERDLWDLLQPTWVDKMGATAWDAPNLPLFEGAPWPTPISVASANGMKQAAPFSGNSEYPWPLPPEWPNFIPGPTATPAATSIGAEIFNALLSRSAPRAGGFAAGAPLRSTAPSSEPSPVGPGGRADRTDTGRTMGQGRGLDPFGGGYTPSAGEHLASRVGAHDLRRRGAFSPYSLDNYDIVAEGSAASHYDSDGNFDGLIFSGPAYIYDPATGAFANLSGTPDRPTSATLDANTGALKIGR
jgi:hypothetical protein